MHSLFLTSVLTFFLTSLTNARHTLAQDADQGVTIYWGFGKERRLADYCAAGEGIDNLVIGSITSLASGGTLTGIFGSSCTVDTDGSFTSGCSIVAADIRTCQAAGKKIFIGFSSDGNKWAIDGASGVAKIASQLWNKFGGGSPSNAGTRPFGSVKADGFDFDVENNPHNQSQAYLGAVVNRLRSNFASDTSKTYYISGAPECAIPDKHMGPAMMEAQFDYLWIQFYNGGCAAADLVKNPKNNPTDIGTYNFNKWPAYLAGGKSSGASLYVGLPASKDGAASWDWITPPNLSKVAKASPGAKGVMLWNTHYSDASVYNGCTYAQNLASVLTTGSTC